LFQDCTPEQKYLSALRLLQGWDDKSINPPSDEFVEANALNCLENKDKSLFKQFCKPIIEKAVNKAMTEMYSDLDPALAKRVRATLYENLSKIAKTNWVSSLKEDFLNHEDFLNSIQTYYEKGLPTIYYSLNSDSENQPTINQSNCSIVLPVQHDIVLKPHELVILNLGVQVYLPAPFYAKISPCENLADLAVYQLNSVSSSGCNNAVKITVKNTSDQPLFLKANTPVVQLIICKKSDGQRANSGSVHSAINSLQLVQTPNSYLHLYLDKYLPQAVHCLELNTTIALPDDQTDKLQVVHQLNSLNHKLMNSVSASTILPLSERIHSRDAVAQQFTNELVARYSELNSQFINDTASAPSDDLKNQILTDMCQKLAVIGVDLIKNQAITRDIFARAQQSDDYLSVIYQATQEKTNDFPSFTYNKGCCTL
jgi:dUTPase